MNRTSFWIIATTVLPMWLAGTASAQPFAESEIADLQRSLAPVTGSAAALSATTTPSEPSRVLLTTSGYVRYLGAPPGQHFVPTNGLVTGQPAVVARNFLRERGRLFGIKTNAVDFVITRERQSGNRNHLRFQQVYQNLPVVAAEVVVQVDAQGGIECVLSDIETDTTPLDNAIVSLTPALTAEQAAAAVKEAFASQAAGAEVYTTTPVLSIFAPVVLDETGPPQLVWDMMVFTENRYAVNERVLWDARGTNAVRVWTHRHTALNRRILDQNNSTNAPTLARTEGQGPSPISDVNNVYTFLGDTYNFYFLRHNRDSYNNAGITLTNIVRYCAVVTNCPLANAFSGPPMLFGSGWTADDIVAHEFTHNVTESESKLVYTNASGAINESFSDIWGEFVDLTNGSGNDNPTNRWRVAEDLATGAIRSMSFPTNFSHPDRRNSSLYQPESNTSDNGGVHSNSGVNNKLCYLLTDGDTFNGQSVYGLGIDQVVRLYYEAQANLLTSGAGWAQLYDSLQQAAVNLGWITADRNNLYRACVAVEIATPGTTLYVNNTTGCAVPLGLANCFPPFGPYETVAQGVNGARPGDTLRVRGAYYAELMTVTKILTIEAYNGTVTIGP